MVAHLGKAKAAFLTCSAERISPTCKISIAVHRQGNLYKRSGHSHKREKIQQQSLYTNKKTHPLLSSPILIYFFHQAEAFSTKLKYFSMSFHPGDKLHLPISQQVWTLVKLYREKQCFVGIQLCLLPPISTKPSDNTDSYITALSPCKTVPLGPMSLLAQGLC